ncbi:hypothetical protein PCASD_18801 [Puccinia coronata f. sp. avenae]|uniref:Uncharacterized protein n=1 Tax=Puccinia coronata f. sp. avenae TaxID=200324 RepID=A0A2N5T9I7_9BASI|nr:hypothetical protein PCASD_18801 [Puccinia coronata f. sp. avenae]
MRRQSLLALLLIAIPASRNLPAPPVTGAEIAGNESGRSAAALGHRDESSSVCSADDRALTRGEDPYSSSLTLYEPKYREIKTEKEVEGDIHHVNNQAQDRIRNVKEDSNKINKKQEALTIQFESIKRSRKDVDRKLLEESRKIVEESQETLLILQEFRISELNNEGARGSQRVEFQR